MTRHALVLSVLAVHLCVVHAHGQVVSERESNVPQRHVALTKESEEGFRRFMDMVRSGKLGADVHEADIDVAEGSVDLKLLRKSAAPMVLHLTRRTSAAGLSRHFDLEARENTSAGDLARVA